MNKELKKRIEDLARRMFYAVSPETNQYLYRAPSKRWEELPVLAGKDWWFENAHTCIRALETYNDPDWKEPEIMVTEPENEPPEPEVA